MRGVCVYNNWNVVPISLKIYRALMRYTTWSFLGGGGGDESPRWGHSPRMRSGGLVDEGSLPNSFGWEFILFIKTHFYGKHSLHISWRSTHLLHLYFLFSCFHQMETCSVSLGNSPVTAENSPVTDEFPSHRPVTRSFDVFFDLRLNKRLSKQ